MEGAVDEGEAGSPAGAGLTREAAQGADVVGRRAERLHTVSEADIAAFAAVSGDYNPVHFDEAFAATTPFRGRIAHGMLSAAWISALLAGELPGPGAVYLGQTLEFKRPIRIGDEVLVSAEVTAVDPKGRMTLRTQCRVRGKLAVEGEAHALLPRAFSAQMESSSTSQKGSESKTPEPDGRRNRVHVRLSGSGG